MDALRRLQAGTTTELDALLPALLDRAFNPDSETEVGARPPRALFSAPSRKTPAAENCARSDNRSWAKNAGRKGASSDARGGHAPRCFGVRAERATKPAGYQSHLPYSIFALSFQALLQYGFNLLCQCRQKDGR